MATAKEESVLEKVEKELADFNKKKSDVAEALKDELAKAKTEYDNLVKEINKKYNVNELDKDIKKHTYFLKLLKGEIAIPDDLNAKKGKVKSSVKGERVPFPNEYSSAGTFVAKALFALNEIKTGDVDAVRAKLLELEPGIKESSLQNLNQTLSKLFGDKKITAERNGKKYIYSI